MKNVIKSAQKRAWEQIKKITTASNMMEVECLINDAIGLTFRTKNLGLIKCAFNRWNNNGDGALLVAYGATTYKNFEHCKAIRTENELRHKDELKKYLIQFIPARMCSTMMYKQLEA